ncbi:MAG: SMC family ATPase [Nanoarchaeota archaeon]|nr:SMC family ATPase [Nanoarchaeota archaeon]
MENIRSYISQRVEFPTGSLLFAGDIGSGKSTVLLAIEFALFGIKSGELSGNALLRHGSKTGSVEIIFEIDGKEVIVKRTLKRMKDRIGQGSGYVVIDGVKHDLMPKEIRARVFELLNYPQSLVSKGQDLIYRFTVYTPQEQMKRIIYEDKDSRLDTLRKVFNIDKYKMIRENTLIYVKALREKKNNFEGRIADLDEKKKSKEELKGKASVLKVEEEKSGARLKEAKEKTSLKRKELSDFESKIKEASEKKKQLALLDSELKNIVDSREKDRKEIDGLQKIILELRDELKDYKGGVSLQGIYEDKERRIQTLEKELMLLRDEKAGINGKAAHLKEASEKIIKLDSCPLCLQKVSHSHKEDIVNKGNKDINEIKLKVEEFEKKAEGLSSNLDSLKKESKELREKISMRNVLKVKKEGLIEKEKRLNLLKENFEGSKNKVADINSKKIDLRKDLQVFSEIDGLYEKAKKEYDALLDSERKTELEKNSLSKEIEGISTQLKALEEEIASKEKVKKELKRIVALQGWLSEKFINLVANMEKHVMLTVYHEFNELFQQWFNMLIEDENMNVRLDDTFSVVIEQNGYETYIDNLSGGEKTSVALAYRLALNKVINDVVSQIKTKDILILDEPTEGFSTNQLDRVRDVLDQLGIKQIIIVSHESKIESFVDTVIRVNKQEGVSEVNG